MLLRADFVQTSIEMISDQDIYLQYAVFNIMKKEIIQHE